MDKNGYVLQGIQQMKMTNIVVLGLILLAVGCSEDGYRIEEGKVVYEKPWNEGHGTIIKRLNADPETFEVLGSDNLSWAKDADTVFWGTIELDFMDSKSFEVINIAFAKDKEKVICGRDIIVETNPNDFRIRSLKHLLDYDEFYGVDKKAVYLCDYFASGYERVLSDSIDSFQLLDDGFYKDNQFVSWGGFEIFDVDVLTFKVLTGGYARDKNYVYYHWRIVDGADVESFRVLEKAEAKDKSYRYFMDERVN